MLFANDHNELRTHIDNTSSNQGYYCPYCGAPMIMKKGDFRQHHFAHKQNHTCLDSWERNHEYDISDWHNEWQSRYPIDNQEIKLSLGQTIHRADVIVDHTVIEFQHSILSSCSFDDRNNFYLNLGYKVIWLFDLSKLVEEKKLIYEKTEEGFLFKWHNPKKALNSYDVQNGCIDLFFQIHSDSDKCIVRVLNVSTSGFEVFTTSDFMRKEEFLEYTGLKEGNCLPPCVMGVEQNLQYQSFKNTYGIHLNPQQERAVQAVEGATLLLAVPGSGKTTVLVARLGHMVINKKIPPQNILAITFTKEAASDMRLRYMKQFQMTDEPGITFCTINALADRIYKEYCKRHDIQYKVLVPNTRGLIGSIYKGITAEYADEQIKLQLATAITSIKNMCLTEDQILQMEVHLPNLLQVYHAYQKTLEARNQMDYDDQLVFAYEIMKSDTEILCDLQKRYQYICVDEAQDTSLIQHKILQILSKSNNIFMVGDEDQSIYGFRGAYPQAMLNFRYDYKNPYILRMERNYRSTEQIVKKANSFISKNKGRYEKNMSAERGPGGAVSVEEVKDRSAQYERLLEIAKQTDVETAFIYRDNESAVPLIDLLARQNIPFKFRRAEVHFFDINVVKDIIAYLTLATDNKQYPAFEQICNKGILYLGAQQKKCAVNACRYDGKNVFDAVDQQMPYVKYRKDRSANFRSVMNNVARLNTYDAITLLLSSGYQSYMEEQHLDSGKIDTLKILAKQEPEIKRFLKRLEVLDQMMANGCAQNSEKCITLTTIHSSKGLEYDTVYMVDVYDGRFPATRSLNYCTSKDSADSEQEERRLFYVGMTRAKNHLHFFKTDSQSKYIEELFPKLVCIHCGVQDTEDKFEQYLGEENGLPIGICKECSADLS